MNRMNVNPDQDQIDIKVEVRVFANLRDLTQFKKNFYIIKKGDTIGALLQDIARSLPQSQKFLQEIIDFSEPIPILRKYFKVILNGRILFTEQALNTPIVKVNSVVAIFPPIGGG